MRPASSWTPCFPRFWKPFADRSRTGLLSRHVTPSGRAAPKSISIFWAFESRVRGALLSCFFPVFSVADFALFHDPAPTPPGSDALRFPAWGLTALRLPTTSFEHCLAARRSWQTRSIGLSSPGRLHDRVRAVDHRILRAIRGRQGARG